MYVNFGRSFLALELPLVLGPFLFLPFLESCAVGRSSWLFSSLGEGPSSSVSFSSSSGTEILLNSNVDIWRGRECEKKYY